MLAIADLKAPPEVHAALQDGRWAGGWLRAKCPLCDPEGRRGKSLAASAQGFGRDRTRPGWKCFRCAGEEHYRRSGNVPGTISYDPDALKNNDKRRREHALQVLERTRSVHDGDPVDRYLRSRGLCPPGSLWPSSIRIGILKHPQTKQKYPTMVASVTDVTNVAVGVHRTYLTDDGHKADVSPVKMSLGPISGGSVRLGIDSETILVAEGIESALGAAMTMDYVPWSSLSTSGMMNLHLPRTVQRVVIAPDRDRNQAGAKAAFKLRARIKGLQKTQNRRIHVEIIHPPLGRSDFADFG